MCRIFQHRKMIICWERQEVKTWIAFQYGWCDKLDVTYLNFRQVFFALLLIHFGCHWKPVLCVIYLSFSCIYRKYESCMIFSQFAVRRSLRARWPCNRYVALISMHPLFFPTFLWFHRRWAWSSKWSPGHSSRNHLLLQTIWANWQWMVPLVG